jgi:ATP-dependent helicase/nuclease subunit B
MDTFLHKIAKHLQASSTPLKDWVIILPSERAKHYLQKALFDVYQTPMFAPTIITIHRFIKDIIDEAIIDKTRLLLALYEVHKEELAQEDSLLFDEFLSWGQIVLSDFDELERYLVDPKYMFRNLRDIKEIENWSFGETNLTQRQQEFIAFWDRLPVYYKGLTDKLAKKGLITSGKAYRKVAENIDLIFRKHPHSQFLFAGFNALSKAEQSIMKQLKTMRRAEIFIDADSFYFHDRIHEAGYFLRKNVDKLGIKELPYIENKLLTEDKEVDIIACSQFTGQAKVAGTLLSIFDKETIDKTLLLLADETLIVPLLNSIPKNVGQANITLGLPIKNSTLRTWIELIFKIQEGFEKYDRTIVYYRDLISFWHHPFISAIMTQEEYTLTRKKEQGIKKYNTLFQDPEKVTISARIDEIFKLLYTPWKQDWSKAIENIRLLNQLLFNKLSTENSFEKAVIKGFDDSIKEFEICISEGFPTMRLRTFKTLFNQSWMQETIAFYGNPLEGLQIMGLLETRLLDFENVIVIGMNEGKMPPTNPIQTLVPMDLRKHLELPLPRDKQGLFAHHFYRLLHHCKRMYITYSTSSEGINASEPSRYLLQLELELARENKNFKINKKYYTLPENESKTGNKLIPKDNDLTKKLDSFLEQGISASAIKTFFTCSLDFYYKYLLKFGEAEKVDENIESNQLGTFVHEVLEQLYKPFCKRDSNGNLVTPIPPKVDLTAIEKMEKSYELLMSEAFSKFFGGNPEIYLKGKNYLSFTMALELTKRFLKHEKNLIQKTGKNIAIEALEERLEHTFEVEIFGTKKQVKLKGFADRVDSIDDEIRIIDYKTGKVEKGDVGKSLSKWAGTDEELLVKLSIECKHFFQLMTYSYLYFKKHNRIVSESSIVSLVSISESPFVIQAKNLSNARIIELFPTVLGMLLEQMYDPETPFVHKEEYFSYCQYCN